MKRSEVTEIEGSLGGEITHLTFGFSMKVLMYLTGSGLPQAATFFRSLADYSNIPTLTRKYGAKALKP